MAVAVNVATGNLATSKKSGLFRWPVRRSVSVQMDFVLILISGVPTIFPSLTLNAPAKFLNPPLCWPVTFDARNPILESERTTYSLADGTELDSAFCGSVAVDLATLSA